MNTYNILVWGLRLAGVGQIFIAVIYCWMRGIVGWDADMEKLRPHNRSIAHTYSRYIQAFNTVFGLICLFQTHELLGGTVLAVDLTLIIAVYWLARVVLHYLYYDCTEITTQRKLYAFGSHAFGLLFAAQTVVLLGAAAYNVGWIK